MGSRRQKRINLHENLKRHNFRRCNRHCNFLSQEELQSIKVQAHKKATKLTSYLANTIKSLKFYLKHLQEKGSHLIDGNFNYSYIDDSDFMNFRCDPATVSQMSSGAQIDPWSS